MSLETQIAALVTAANNLTNSVNGKMGQIDQKVIDAKAEYNDLVNGIRGDFPFYALSQNQALKFGGVLSPQGTATQPDGWIRRDETITTELVATVLKAQAASERPEEARALLMDIYGSVPNNLFRDFNIVKVTFGANVPIENNYSIYQGPLNRSTVISYGAFVKVLSGDIAFGLPLAPASSRVAADGKWHEKIQYRSLALGGTTYEHGPHLYGSYGASCLIALPAAVAGKVPPGSWMMFNKPKFVDEMGGAQ